MGNHLVVGRGWDTSPFSRPHDGPRASSADKGQMTSMPCISVFLSWSVDPVPQEGDSYTGENFNHLSLIHSSIISTSQEMPQEGEVFALSQQDPRPVPRPETPSAPVAEFMNMGDSERIPPRPHSHPRMVPANGGLSSGPTEQTRPYSWPIVGVSIPHVNITAWAPLSPSCNRLVSPSFFSSMSGASFL